MLEILDSLILGIGYIAIGVAIGAMLSELRLRLRLRKEKKEVALLTYYRSQWHADFSYYSDDVINRINTKWSKNFYSRQEVDAIVADLEARLLTLTDTVRSSKDKYSL